MQSNIWRYVGCRNIKWSRFSKYHFLEKRSGTNVEETFRLSLFQVASIISTTGYATTDFNAWPALSKVIILMLLLILGFIAVILFCGYIVLNAPEISEERLYKSNATVLYDKDGKEFARLGAENRESVWVRRYQVLYICAGCAVCKDTHLNGCCSYRCCRFVYFLFICHQAPCFSSLCPFCY